MVVPSKPGVDALLLLLLPAVSGHLGDATSSGRHRQTRHVHPTLEPTAKSEPASAETGEYVLDANNDVWIAAASSPPIAATTNAPHAQLPKYDAITTDAAFTSSSTTNDKLDLEEMASISSGMPRGGTITADATMSSSTIADQFNLDEMMAGNAQSAAGPIFGLRHGRGAFAITGGAGCYRNARGQAQADFGVQRSRVHLFVPSISWIFDDIDENAMRPQDTTWTRHRRMQEAQECNLFREGADSFNIISLNLERRSNPPDPRYIKESRTSHHEHGVFWAQEQWFEGISGEYSLSCVHHDCILSFHFGIGPSTSDPSSKLGEKRNLVKDEDDRDEIHNHQVVTSLNLQGTTELAYQGADTDLLVCIENCGEMGSTYNSQIEADAEHYEAINLRNFDNTESLVQLDIENTNECLVLACSGEGKGKSGSKGTSGCSDTGKNGKNRGKSGKNSGKNRGKNGKRRLKSSSGKGGGGYDISDYVNATDGTECTGGTCMGGVCVPAVAAVATLNNPPLANNDIYSYLGQQLYSDEISNLNQGADFSEHGVMLNDFDPDGDLLTTIAVNQDARNVGKTITLSSGTNLRVEADGSILYDPGNKFESLDTGVVATETFEYSISDGHGNTEIATVTIVIEGKRDAPAAIDDTEETTTEDMVLSSNVLWNDSDPEGDTLAVETINGFTGNVGQEITLPSGALVTLTSDGTYTFDPNGQFESLNDSEIVSETFHYTITDGFGGTAGAAVSIVITGVNDPPLAQNIDLGPSPARSTISFNLLDNAIDPELNGLSVTEVEGQSIANDGVITITLSSGVLVTIDGSSGDTSIDPHSQFDSLAGGQIGIVTFDYVVADGDGATDSGIVTLTLQGSNDPPVAVDDSKAIRAGSLTSGILLENDDDPEGDPLTITHVEDVLLDPTMGHAVVTLSSGAMVAVRTNGEYTYDPSGQYDSLGTGEEGVDTFTYTISDGNDGTDEGTVAISVIGINDPPVAEDKTTTTLADLEVNGTMLGNDEDPEGDILTVTHIGDILLSPIPGEIVATLSSGATVTVNSSGHYTYDPNGQFDSLGTGEEGIDTIAYTVSDGNGGSDEGTVTIIMLGVNDPPTAEDKTITTLADLAVSGSAIYFNDDDPENDDLTLMGVNGHTVYPAFGSVFLSLPSGAMLTVSTNGEYTYDPHGQFDSLRTDEEGTDAFTFTISDGNDGTDEGTVTIVMIGINDPPTAEDKTTTTLAHLEVSGALLENDEDPEGDPLTITHVEGDILSPASDETVVTLSSGATVTVSSSGHYTYDPNGQFDLLNTGEEGVDTFTYTISDGKDGADEGTVTILVLGVNDPPEAVDDTGSTTGEDSIVSGSVLENDNDPDGDNLTVNSVEGATGNVGQEITLPSGALVTFTPDGTYTFDPNGQFESLNDSETASETFHYSITDGEGHTTEEATVTVTITGTNDPPLAQDVDLGPSPARSTISYNLLDNVIDPEENGLSVTEVEGQSTGEGGPNSITLSSGVLVTIDGSTGDTIIDPNGQFNSLNADETAQLNFDYVVADGDGDTGSGIVTLTLVGQDTSAPSAAPTELFVCPDERTNAATQGTISGSNLSGGTTTQTLQFDLFASAFTSNGKACIDGLVGLKPPFNILFVIDVSGSTRNLFSGTAVGDINGDGITNTILDAQIDSVLKAVEAIVSTPSLTNDNVNIGVVTFSTFASYVGNWPPADEDNPEAINPGLETTLKTLRGRGYTNFDDALDKAIVYFEGSDSNKGGAPDVNTRTNRMYFLSDGLPNQCGDGDPNTAEDYCGEDEINNDYAGATVFTSELLSLGQYSVANYAIGVGLGSDVSAGSGLDKIDNTENPKTGDKAVQVTTTDALTNIILENPVYSEVLYFKLEVNGAVVAGVDETSLVTGLNGYVLGVNEMSGLDSTSGAINTIVATALLDFDGDPSTPNDQLELRTVARIIGTEGSSTYV